MPSAPSPLSSSTEPVEVPAPADPANRAVAAPAPAPSSRQARREAAQARQARLRLRHVGVGSVLAVAALWSAGLLLAGLVATYFLFKALESTGALQSITEASATVLGDDAPRQVGDVYYFFTADWVLTRAAVVGALLAGAFLVFCFLATVMVNAASSLVGGIRLTLEEPPPPRSERRAARRAERERDRELRAAARAAKSSERSARRARAAADRKGSEEDALVGASASSGPPAVSQPAASSDREHVAASEGTARSRPAVPVSKVKGAARSRPAPRRRVPQPAVEF